MVRRVLLFLSGITVIVAQCAAAADETTKDEAVKKPATETKVIVDLGKRDGVYEDISSADDNSKWGTDDNTYNNDDNNNENNNDYNKNNKNSNKYEQQEEKNTYVAAPPQPPQSSGAYGDGRPSHSGLAQVIPPGNNQNLDDIYRQPQQNPYGVYQNNKYQGAYNNMQPQIVRKDVLLLVKAARDFDQLNPRNNNSQWQWAMSALNNVSADNAAFVVHLHQQQQNIYNSYGQQQQPKYNSYGKKQHSPKGNDDYVDLISIPFNQYYPDSDGYFEGVIESKTAFNINPQQRFVARMDWSCHTINTENNPFPSMLVTYPQNDPRLANCVFGLKADVNGTDTFEAFFSVTNQGVFAGVTFFANDVNAIGALQFTAKRRVGVRPRYDSLVDGAVEIDRRLNVVNFYLNGYLVWSVPIGLPPPADGITSLNLGQGTPMAATVSAVQIYLGTTKCPDEFDPNNPMSMTRLVNLGPGSTYYGLNDTFYDPAALKFNQVFGQGATMRLFKLIVVRADSVPPPIPMALPGVYGASAPVYHQPNTNNKYKSNNNNNGYEDDEYIRK